MSSMAKIFVVVNLVLAVMVFGAAATLLGAQDDYKTEVARVTKEFGEIKAQYDKTLTALSDQVAQQNARASQESARANNEANARQAVEAQLTEARTANETLRSSVEAFSQELAQLRQVNQNFEAMVRSMQEASRSATTEKLDAVRKYEAEVANRVRLEQEVGRQSESIQTLSAEKGDLANQLRQANFWLNKYRERYGPMDTASEGQEGRVLDVRTGDFGILVGISVGSEDGVKQGDLYHIRRGAQYVGRITITTVMKNQAVGAFDTEFPGSAAPPQRGDVAYPGN